MTTLSDPLTLRSGAIVPNRIAKAAMEEQLAAARRDPGRRLATLYRRWGEGGAGLLITGHVMVDRRAMAQPGDVVLDGRSVLEPFRAWAAAAGATPVWMQINHPGRVVRRDTRGVALAPSAVPVDAGRFSAMYPVPTPMTVPQIRDTVARFARTARLAQRAGFAGVEIHAAHGYLLSQFLSPLVNRRDDEWGGTLRNRARLLLETTAAVRDATAAPFAVAVKLNSADFQRGGFDIDDAGRVIDWLDQAGVDLVELSGGSIESLATAGRPADGRTLAREAYFLDLARQLAESASVPLMLTGGIRRGEVAQRVIDAGFALAGVGTALAIAPGAPHAWLAGDDAAVSPPRSRLRSKVLRAAAEQAAVTARLHGLARGHRAPAPPPVLALAADQARRSRQLRRYLREPRT